MFNFFKKEEKVSEKEKPNFEIELTASVLAYELARSDGEITEDELSVGEEIIDWISMLSFSEITNPLL